MTAGPLLALLSALLLAACIPREPPAPAHDVRPVAAVEAQRLILKFAAGSPEMLPGVEDSLDELARSLAEAETQVLVVARFAGLVPAERNLMRRLAVARALRVRERLVDGGVDELRIRLRACGQAGDGILGYDQVKVYITRSADRDGVCGAPPPPQGNAHPLRPLVEI
jgi:hypothetical protein